MIAVCRLAVSQEGGRAAVADDRDLQAGGSQEGGRETFGGEWSSNLRGR